MRRLIAIPLLALIALAAPGCRLKGKSNAKAVADDGQLVSVVTAADPKANVQLVRGFHGVENGSWRWTTKDFTATLLAPAGAAQKGAKLELKFTIPDAVFNRVGDMTLSAKVNGTDLGPEKYSKAGEAVYIRDVPALAFSGDAVNVDFTVDKGLPPTDQDARELAVIMTSVGLSAK